MSFCCQDSLYHDDTHHCQSTHAKLGVSFNDLVTFFLGNLQEFPSFILPDGCIEQCDETVGFRDIFDIENAAINQDINDLAALFRDLMGYQIYANALAITVRIGLAQTDEEKQALRDQLREVKYNDITSNNSFIKKEPAFPLMATTTNKIQNLLNYVENIGRMRNENCEPCLDVKNERNHIYSTFFWSMEIFKEMIENITPY
ncbi:CLUMA_CG005249, isoform A [Clunio marinus]|uniref:CLUMA_CG005249, isoform A n=1 Tax=Clunio marinus TaxID=568069 RepID=A0A1J1HUB5_9DIPT|nr:CLUMA_CG005249, isoform A [Clunio marinus]